MHPALIGHVRQLRVIANVRPGVRIEKIPDGSTSMLLRSLGGGVGDLSLAGPRTRALFKEAPPAEIAVLVDFEPGAGVPFLGVPAHVIADRYARAEDVWGEDGARVRDRLLAARSSAEARAMFELALVERLRRSPPSASARLVRRAVARLADTRVRVGLLAAELGVSARHFRRVFTDAVGVGPKEFARMARLQRAMALSAASWTERALEAGYYDQAHFIAEFRELVGTTPTRYSKQRAEPNAASGY